ncbi:tyrosine-type recombinase/integrase [Mesorhizobium loti]|uniref:tyrosine-type recombinase/integrase n=1 Tax=Rhizobium loti TaxID=381 RepID=UPI000539A436|nr:tyrosine-type recombinase/integrase [Mesorhizobium loti]
MHVLLHEIRHTYASAMVRNGAPLIVVAEALVHSDIRMAEKHYAHLAPSYVADTIRRLAPNIQAPDWPGGGMQYAARLGVTFAMVISEHLQAAMSLTKSQAPSSFGSANSLRDLGLKPLLPPAARRCASTGGS